MNSFEKGPFYPAVIARVERVERDGKLSHYEVISPVFSSCTCLSREHAEAVAGAIAHVYPGYRPENQAQADDEAARTARAVAVAEARARQIRDSEWLASFGSC